MFGNNFLGAGNCIKISFALNKNYCWSLWNKKKNVQRESLILNKNTHFGIANKGGKCETGVFCKQPSVMPQSICLIYYSVTYKVERLVWPKYDFYSFPRTYFLRTVLYTYFSLHLHHIKVKHFKFLHSRSKSDRLYEAIIPAGILYF